MNLNLYIKPELMVHRQTAVKKGEAAERDFDKLPEDFPIVHESIKVYRFQLIIS